MKSKKFLKVAGVLLLLYTVIGFWVFPMTLRYFGEKALRDYVSPDAVITKVKANPFTWQVQVEGVQLSDPAGQWSLEAERATVNLSAKTLYKFYPVLDLLSLESPRIQYLRSPQEQEETEEVVVETEEEAPESLEEVAHLLNTVEIPKVFVALLEIKNGAVNFSDVTNESDFDKSIDPINFRLENFTTEVGAGEGNTMSFLAKTDRGAELEWTGKLTSQPFTSHGTIRVVGFEIHSFSPYFEKFIRFDLEGATYGMQFSYAINFGDLENVFSVHDGSVALTDIRCVGREDADEFFVLDSAGISGFAFDYHSMQLDVERVSIGGGVLGVRRDGAGAINLLNLLALPATEAVEISENVEAAEPTETVAAGDGSIALPELPVGFSLGEFLLHDFHVRWVDSMIPGGADFDLVISEYSLKELSSDFSQPVGLTVLLLAGESGRITANGELTPAVAGMDLSLGVEALDLSLANAYGLSLANTRVRSGVFDYSGALQGEFEPGYTLIGEGSVRDFSVTQSGGNAVDLAWKSFRFADLSAKTKPLSIKLGDLVLTEPTAVLTRLAVEEPEDADELEKAAMPVTVEDPAEPGEEVAMEATADAEPPESVEAPLDIDIASFAVEGGSFLLVDESIQPTFRFEVAEAEVDVKNITLGKEKLTEFSISAMVNRSPFEMAGSAYPIDPRSQTRMTMSLRELSLPVFSPYSGQAVGRKVGSGWFTLNTDLQVDSGDLQASNQIKIDQLELGESVESPNAVKLPLSLAISLLKGSDGVMNLELPLTGDLYEPNIGLGQIVRTAVFGLIRGVALSPFSMLSGLVGSEADLSQVEFAPASSELSPKMAKQLVALGTALQERPQLILRMTPSLSDDDLTSLANQSLSPGSAMESEGVAESKAIRDHQFMIGRKGKSKSTAQVVELVEPDETNPLPAMDPTDPIATELMAARLQVVREHLIEIDGVAEDRISVLDPDLSAKASIVRFSLE